ncbi:fes cip4 domain-containing protein [Colletotrichum karsti]|uniref:Fes cip4 domain-containing protein n=1 Tax=Colletotrichum karsti TaxID=1095194 RepID=A0A9P6I2D2_9PEZI|nr:fes cip4 domain-containing protein [Colletotrichum karsti]KAF9874764.1 fes cip4 domain-containing protein [Colletotrichum karsti]
MDDLARAEYPAMLPSHSPNDPEPDPEPDLATGRDTPLHAHLQPMQAVNVLTDRVKRITKINAEIADWMQERRRVEDQYVQSLRKLLSFKVPNASSELGVFSGPWDKVLQSVDATAHSHHVLASQLDKDVENPLRSFQSRKEMQNMQTISANLTAMARDLEDAQKKTDALTRKGPKTNAQKMADATARLEQATQQWDSQAPFIFETLQALDEQRVNQLRDLLTQYQTHESDQAQRGLTRAAETLASMLEISTELEIASFKEKVISGRPRMEKRVTTSRQSSHPPTSQTLAPPPPPSSLGHHDDDTSDHSGAMEGKTESKLRSRIGTMLGRRRQSIHGGFGPISPQKTGGGPPSFGRGLSSSHSSTHVRPGLSPRASSNNLAETNNRLSALAETPDSPRPPQSSGTDKPLHEGTNGFSAGSEGARLGSSAGTVNGNHDTDVLDVAPPPGPPPSQTKEPEAKDAEGFTIRPPADDPISQAQREAAEENEQMFKLNIASSPIAEEDADAKEAALTNVANTLTQMAAPSRKLGTVRGRRDVRNTIYVPPPNMPELTNENPFPTSPSLPSQSSKPTTVAALASEASIAATSDTQSIRSANSLVSLAHLKHPDMHEPGLNASIIETVSATFEEGEVKSAKVQGEIAFAYHAAENSAQEREIIRINNFPSLEVIGPNRIFVQNSPDKPDEFNLDVSHLNKTATAFTYRVHASDAGLASHVPLLIRPAWKPQGDKLGLLLQYSLNPASNLTAPVTLQNVVFVATYEGARASGAQTKPTGTHLKDKHLVYWRLGDLTLTAETQKIVCRIIGAENAEPKPGHIEARWEFTPESLGSGISISRLEETKGKGKEEDADPFADDNPTSPALPADQQWVDVKLVKKITSGKYEAK